MRWRACAACLIVLIVAAACSGGASATPTPAPDAATSTPTAEATATPPGGTGEPSVSGPADVAAGAAFQVTWTGPNAERDYVTIVASGATRWTNENYFYTTVGSPGTLVAPLGAGTYELWYVNGVEAKTTATSPITVKAFQGTLAGPDQVGAGAPFQASWTGPNGPGDYVTIIALGNTAWRDESYFYTRDGAAGDLTAPITPGSYELWYVTGQDPAPQVRRPITVTALQVALDAPARVRAGDAFTVTWTGPNGPSDYLTIVKAGSPVGSYGEYVYTSSGSPITLHAPAETGNYEIWYASDRVAGTFATRAIIVE